MHLGTDSLCSTSQPAQQVPISQPNPSRFSTRSVASTSLLVQAENCEEGGVDTPLFFGCEVSSKISQSAEIHSSYVLNQDPGLSVFDLDLRSE